MCRQFAHAAVGFIQPLIQRLHLVEDGFELGIQRRLIIAQVLRHALQLLGIILKLAAVVFQFFFKIPKLLLQFQQVALDLFDVFLGTGLRVHRETQ